MVLLKDLKIRLHYFFYFFKLYNIQAQIKILNKIKVN